MNDRDASDGAGGSPLHALVMFGFVAAATMVPAFRVWPLLWIVPILGYALVVAAFPSLRGTFRMWCFGRVSAARVAAASIIAVGSCTVLILFHHFTHPDVRSYGSFLPVSKLGGVLVCGVLFSVLNAFFEELIFRGILFDGIAAEWGEWIAMCATAFLFGYGHLRGYPPGPTGAVLAGAYGLSLGWLRVYSAGLGLPFLVHITADATIFILVVQSAA